jgi:hypothetical protein
MNVKFKWPFVATKGFVRNVCVMNVKCKWPFVAALGSRVVIDSQRPDVTKKEDTKKKGWRHCV